jgi:pimeloyl-ACP methyl ester carboxylesterase
VTGEVLRIGELDVHVEGAGPETIVMVHGWPDTHRLWDAQVETLKDRYRCARFDLPGYGPSEERRARTLDELTDALTQVVDRLSPGGRVILLLHDWGCFFGYEFYLRHPQRVSRIVGVDIGDPVSLARALALPARAAVFLYQLFLATAWIVGGGAGDAMTRWMARRMRCPADPELIGARMNYPYFMTWFGGAQSYRHRAQTFVPRVPMLFAYGRRKPFMWHAPAWVEDLRRQPGSEVVEFDTGHWVMAQQPQRFNDVVGRWLRAVPAP